MFWDILGPKSSYLFWAGWSTVCLIREIRGDRERPLVSKYFMSVFM
jgi:hypothetical protein